MPRPTQPLQPTRPERRAAAPAAFGADRVADCDEEHRSRRVTSALIVRGRMFKPEARDTLSGCPRFGMFQTLSF